MAIVKKKKAPVAPATKPNKKKPVSQGITVRGGELDIPAERRKAAKKVKNLKPIKPIDRRKIKKHNEDDDPEVAAEKADKNFSMFERKLKFIKKAAAKHDYGEQAMLKMYKGLLDTVLDLIPVAERTYRKWGNERAAYPINLYINQAREIANDMRSLQSFEEQANRIVTMSRESFSLAANHLVNEAYRIRKEISADMPDELRKKFEMQMNVLVQSHGKFLNESSKGFAERIFAFMVERPTNRP